MTTRPTRFLRILVLAVLTACGACASREPTGPTLPPDAFRLPRPSLQASKGPEYAAPQLAVGLDGNVYLLWLGIRWTKSWDVLLARSEDYGATWSNTSLVLKSEKSRIAGGIRIAADRKGHVYVAWREMDHDKRNRDLILMRSEDHGRHWEEPRTSVTKSHDLAIPQLFAEPEGTVYIGWIDGSEHHRHLDLSISSDFGVTISPTPIRLIAVNPRSLFGVENVRLASDGGGHLYAVWREINNPRDHRIYLSRTVEGGEAWASEPILLNVPDLKVTGGRNPWIVAGPNGRVYVTWEQSENRSPTPREPDAMVDTDKMVYLNRSLDYGHTWLPQPIRVNEPGSTPVTVLNPQISIGRDGNVYALWLEAREDQDPKRLMFAHSADSGLTWSAPAIRLDLTSPFGRRPSHPMIQSDNSGHVWVLWQELTPRPRGWQLLSNRSDDHGRTWRQQAVPLTGPDQRAGTYRGVAFKQDDGGRLYVAWDGGGGNSQEMYFNRSADFGVSWLPREVRVGPR